MESSPVRGAPSAGDEAKRLQRSGTNRWIAGVSGGLAEYFGLHAAIYRVLFVALAFAGGTGILLYIAAALVMPAEGRDESVLADTLRRHRDRPWLVIVLALLALALIFALSDPGGGFGLGLGGVVLLLVLGGVVLVWTRAARRDARRSEASGRSSVRWRVSAVAAITAVVLAGLLAVAAAAAKVDGGIGDRTERPASVAELEREYRLGFGYLGLDLQDLELPRGETRVRATLGVGELEITVPSDVAVAVTANARWGEVDVLGRRTEGRRPRARYVDPGFEGASRRLVVEAEVRGPGELTVRR
ncbi:MAG: PspC domain-containing protein [Thermoleophilia bacterium]|nr:PspC domain-containing protein [Thermoleophilia bacterium]